MTHDLRLAHDNARLSYTQQALQTAVQSRRHRVNINACFECSLEAIS